MNKSLFKIAKYYNFSYVIRIYYFMFDLHIVKMYFGILTDL